MKKKIIILLSILSFISISAVIINTIQDKILLEKHREFYNNYEELEYKAFKVKKFGVYEGYLVVFFDEMDKEFFRTNIYDYEKEGQFCLYKNGEFCENVDVYNFFKKEKTFYKINVRFDIYSIFFNISYHYKIFNVFYLNSFLSLYPNYFLFSPFLL